MLLDPVGSRNRTIERALVRAARPEHELQLRWTRPPALEDETGEIKFIGFPSARSNFIHNALSGLTGVSDITLISESDHVDLVERRHYAAAASATENAQTEAKLVGFEKIL